ncbi:hypothetical protein PF005_g17458 [Phytophthora fragariae]|uniref:Uncharacterized protein n=1 Tax=Phytophthora fragariae TaxID=53985 RepID=A0A6A3UEI6_9STRA|nr:hypothetical protein PF009_g7933 [Phytophthora fragariae]KAE8982028.1 hypothetical protein PF011_g21793 [Phytophthora fragariae]KAE9094932.1 hypothetical protein PF007_g17583 [Phytophthora fragariae]KAE9124161.1 hypothetical protein PF010_g6107 [Phytophthora fragariae]KAE9149983.1 hypothetical protein PF006_g5604 [Phytophthora fragariae]
MKSEPLSRALTSANSFDERLRDVFSWHAATEVLDEICPNNLNAAQAPPWLRILPPNITAGSYVDDVMITLQPLAGDRCGHLMLAPNTLEQMLRRWRFRWSTGTNHASP